MARRTIATDQIVKLIVGAGQASPSPPVGPALGSKGVKSMDFCKVFRIYNAMPQTNSRCIGIQCPHSTYDTRCSHPNESHSPPRSIVPF